MNEKEKLMKFANLPEKTKKDLISDEKMKQLQQNRTEK